MYFCKAIAQRSLVEKELSASLRKWGSSCRRWFGWTVGF